MKIRNCFSSILPLCMLLLVTGCASVPMTSSDDDAKAKSFTVRSGKANIYLYRNEVFGAALKMTVSVNGKVAGQTASKTYFLWEVDPGIYDISSIAENTSTVKLIAEAGKSYFIWQEMKMGLFAARSELKQVDDDTGRKAVAECTRVQSSL